HSWTIHIATANKKQMVSADMIHRNLERRIEALCRKQDPRLAKQLSDVLDSALDPATRCWTLSPDGPWEPTPPPVSGITHVRDHQAEMMLRHASGSATEAE